MDMGAVQVFVWNKYLSFIFKIFSPYNYEFTVTGKPWPSFNRKFNSIMLLLFFLTLYRSTCLITGKEFYRITTMIAYVQIILIA